MAPSTGGVVSRTVTVNDFDAVFAAVSVAVHVTVDALIANVDPDAGRQDTVAPTASVTEGVT